MSTLDNNGLSRYPMGNRRFRKKSTKNKEENMNKLMMFAAAVFALGTVAVAADAEQELQKFAPEAKAFKTVYVVDAFSGVDKGNKKYVKDYSDTFAGKKFKKIGYYLRLVGNDGKVQQVFVTMDPFSQNAKEIGVPAMNPKKNFQVNVSNLTVKSNVPGVKNGTFPKGNIEFWATNYAAGNGAKIPGADNAKFDFGDTPAPTGNYGSMQIHNTAEKQTVMAYNHWVTGKNAEVGIGNQSVNNPDWTFSNSGKNYKTADLVVLVQL